VKAIRPYRPRYSIRAMMATLADHTAKFLALVDAACAPATSPMAHLRLTWVAKTIEAMPYGMKHSTVVTIAQIR